MSLDGQGESASNGAKLDWTARVLSEEDVRSRFNGQPEIVLRPNTIVTPSAVDELKRRGMRIVRQTNDPAQASASRWAYAQDRDYPLVKSVTQALRRDGLELEQAVVPLQSATCRWAGALAQLVSEERFSGVVAFCEDTGLVCCVANKVRGVRAAAAGSGPGSRLCSALGANFVGIGMAGRSFFELKQLVKAVCAPEPPAVSSELAQMLRELESHAHR